MGNHSGEKERLLRDRIEGLNIQQGEGRAPGGRSVPRKL